jgi:hypothetical protein
LDPEGHSLQVEAALESSSPGLAWERQGCQQQGGRGDAGQDGHGCGFVIGSTSMQRMAAMSWKIVTGNEFG